MEVFPHQVNVVQDSNTGISYAADTIKFSTMVLKECQLQIVVLLVEGGYAKVLDQK